MTETLTSFETILGRDGRLDTPAAVMIKDGARVLVTILEQGKSANAQTQAALEEPIGKSQRFQSVEELMKDLES